MAFGKMVTISTGRRDVCLRGEAEGKRDGGQNEEKAKDGLNKEHKNHTDVPVAVKRVTMDNCK